MTIDYLTSKWSTMYFQLSAFWSIYISRKYCFDTIVISTIRFYV